MTAYNVAYQGRYPVPREKCYDVTVTGSFATTTLNINDTYKFCFIPANCLLIAIGLQFPDMDSNGSPLLTWDLGDSVSATQYLSASTGGQAAGSVIGTGVPNHYTADDNLILKVHAAAATAVEGTIYFAVSYVLDYDGNPFH